MRRLTILLAVLFLFVAPVYAQYSFTNIDYPGGLGTTIRGINNHGQIAGAYSLVGYWAQNNALYIDKGQFIPLAPETILGTSTFTIAWKNNERGDVVGYYLDTEPPYALRGYLYRKGALTLIDYPAAPGTIVQTQAWAINSSGMVVGNYDVFDTDWNYLYSHGFTWRNGVFTDVLAPGATFTVLFGVNDRGDMVGISDAENVNGSGLLVLNGKFVSYAPPVDGAVWSQLNAINEAGAFVGVYQTADDALTGASRAFVVKGGSLTEFTYPDSWFTTAWDINAAGQIVGSWYDFDGMRHGFLAQPGGKSKPSGVTVMNPKGTLKKSLAGPLDAKTGAKSY